MLVDVTSGHKATLNILAFWLYFAIVLCLYTRRQLLIKFESQFFSSKPTGVELLS